MIYLLILQQIFLQAMDLILTYGSIERGLTYEANPVMAEMISINWYLFFAVKIGIVTMMIYTVYALGKYNHPAVKKAQAAVLIFINIFYVVNFASNLSNII